MTLTVRARNWLYLFTAWVVCLISAWSGSAVVTPYLPFEALGMLLPAAVPAWAGQVFGRRWPGPPRVWHHWTLLLAILSAFGLYYGRTH